MLTHKKGQSATEAAVLIAFLTFFLIVTLASVSDDLVHATDDRFTAQLLELADVIEQEATIAFSSENGYYHGFILPPTLNGKAYSVGLMNSSSIGSQVNITLLYVASASGRVNLNVTKVLARDVLGTVKVGRNSVRKENGIVIFLPLRKFIGEPCDANSECLSDVCGTDADSDTYLVFGTGTCQAALTQLDCLDSNANVHPGQTAYFGTPYGGSSFDYNCDTLETIEPGSEDSLDNCDTQGGHCPGCGTPIKAKEFNPACSPTSCGGIKNSCDVQFYLSSCAISLAVVRSCGLVDYCAGDKGIISATLFTEAAPVGCH